MNKHQAIAETSLEEQTKSALAAADCGTAVWHARNLQIGGGMATLLGWARQAMEEAGVTDITTSTWTVRGVGPQNQRVVAMAQNINCDPPGSGVGIPCFAALSVSDTTVSQANSLNTTISNRWGELMGL